MLKIKEREGASKNCSKSIFYIPQCLSHGMSYPLEVLFIERLFPGTCLSLGDFLSQDTSIPGTSITMTFLPGISYCRIYIPKTSFVVHTVQFREYRHCSISTDSISAIFDLTHFIILSYFPPL